MPAFEYSALDTAGRTHKGVLEGETARQVRQQLRERGLLPTTVQEVERKEAARGKGSLGSSRGISAGDLAMLTDMGVAKISGFIAEDFVGVRINQRVAAPENLPLIPLVLGDALDEGAIAGAQRDATFRSGDDACRTVELVGADHQRFGQERFDH